jgi:hypothetical protein
MCTYAVHTCMCGCVDTHLHNEFKTHRRHMFTGEQRLEKGATCAFGLNPFMTSYSASVLYVATLSGNDESLNQFDVSWWEIEQIKKGGGRSVLGLTCSVCLYSSFSNFSSNALHEG